MPTIQFHVTDEQFAHLQKLSGQATGTKALQTIITEYEQLQELHEKLMSNYDELEFQKDALNNLLAKIQHAHKTLANLQDQSITKLVAAEQLELRHQSNFSAFDY